MKAHEKKKAYKQFCARQLRAGFTPDASTGVFGKGNCPDSTRHHLVHGCHIYKVRSGQ